MQIRSMRLPTNSELWPGMEFTGGPEGPDKMTVAPWQDDKSIKNISYPHILDHKEHIKLFLNWELSQSHPTLLNERTWSYTLYYTKILDRKF